MTERDVERITTPATFVATLRRIADAIEAEEGFRIQVLHQRLSVPHGAELAIEHEASDGEHEIELQIRWKE